MPRYNGGMSKRTLYIVLTTVLGIMLGFLVHALAEMWAIDLIVQGGSPFGLTLTIDQWFTVHRAWSMVTLVGGAVTGFFLGKYWWRLVYIEHRHFWHKRI